MVVPLGLAGFEYHGPQRHIGFASCITPGQFRTASATADRWGTYEQPLRGDRQWHTLETQGGQMALARLACERPEGKSAGAVKLKANGRRPV